MECSKGRMARAPTSSYGIFRRSRRTGESVQARGASRPNHKWKQMDANERKPIMAIERWRPRRGLAQTRRDSPSTLTPFTSLAPLERQISDVFDRFFQGFPMLAGTGMEGRMWAPALDVIDRKDEVLVRADLPGLEQKDVEVEIQDGTLTLRGQRTEEREEKEGDYYCSERWAGAFDRSIALPAGVDTEHVNATFKSGVLEVHIPKTSESKGKRIEIQAS